MDNIWRKRFGAPARSTSEELRVRAHDYVDGAREIWHSHEYGQLVHATQGVIRVLTRMGAWTVPPAYGFWIAPGVDHELHMVGEVAMRALYVESDQLPTAWQSCRLIRVEPLLRELILGMLAPDAHTALLTPLLLHQLISATETEGCRLPLPRDKRVLSVCEMLLEDPANPATLEDWSESIGASVRTLRRRFRDETGLSFNQWRQQLRIAEAVCQLAQGRPLGAIARDMGYANGNAFGAMFKRVLGEAPSRYLGKA